MRCVCRNAELPSAAMNTEESDPHTTDRPPYTDDDYDPGWEIEEQLLPTEVDESELLDYRPVVPAPVSEFEDHSGGESGGEVPEPCERASDASAEVVRHHPSSGIRGSARIKSAEELLEKYRADRSHLFEKNEEPKKKLSAAERSRIRAMNSPEDDEIREQRERDQEWRRRMSVDHDHHYLRDEINLRLDADRVWAENRWFEQDFRDEIERSFEYRHPFASILIPFCGIVFICSIPVIWFLFWLFGG